jgi:hypothetical protein|tara:strand:- start:18789 stop:19712 length:924 start_codon:yes stop_codon:yes gene_type:complete
MHKDILVQLDHQGILAIRGEDAAKFLQGYVTCDVDAVTPAVWQMGAFCNLQGRMLSSFLIINSGDGYLLKMDRELVTTTHDFLRKYLPFFNAETVDVSDDYRLIGIAGPGAKGVIERLFPRCPSVEQPHFSHDGTQLMLLHPDPDRFELWLSGEGESELMQALPDQFVTGDADPWKWMDIQQGIGWVVAATSEKFVPQMMNYQLIDAIDFDKGCYLGQEIVARMQYRGELKRQMYHALVDGGQRPISGAPVNTQAGDAVGTVISAVAVKKGHELLAVLQNGDDSQPFFLDSGEKITLLPLPYTINNS